MSTIKNKLLYTIIAMTLSVFNVTGQYSTSPYSHYGAGDIVLKGMGQSIAMGGTFNGLRTFNQINFLNPASYTAQDTNSFMLDVSLFGNYTTYKTENNDALNRNFTLNNLAIAFPVNSWWKSSVGLIPYSRLGYNIKTIKQEAGYDSVSYTYQGMGGLNHLYFGNAFNLSDHLSFGFNLIYVFGYVEHDKEIGFPEEQFEENQYLYSAEINDRNIYGDIFFNTGLQYFNKINKDWLYTIGLTYQHNTKINTLRTYTTRRLQNTQQTSFNDTITHIDEVKEKIHFPKEIGLGFSLELKDKLLIAADFKYVDWENKLSDIESVKPLSNSTQPDNNSTSYIFDNYTNSQTFHAGLEYIPDKFSFRYYFKRIHYRIGGHYSNSYLLINDEQIKDMGLSVGLGLPFKYTHTTFNLTYEYGIRGTTNNGLIQENYNMFYVNLTFYDFWFFRPKID